MRFDKFTIKAQTAIEEAQNITDRHSHQELSPIHLLVALLGQSEGVVRPILEKFGARPETLQVEIERQALLKEEDAHSRERLKLLAKDLAELEEKSDRLKAAWQTEKVAIARIRALKAEIEQHKIEQARAEREGNLTKAAEIRYGKLVAAERELEQAHARLAERQKGQRMLKEEVDEEDVARIVAKWTGIPVAKMLEGETQKLVRMEERLGQRVVG